jgi:hypothetical protein
MNSRQALSIITLTVVALVAAALLGAAAERIDAAAAQTHPAVPGDLEQIDRLRERHGDIAVTCISPDRDTVVCVPTTSPTGAAARDIDANGFATYLDGSTYAQITGWSDNTVGPYAVPEDTTDDHSNPDRTAECLLAQGFTGRPWMDGEEAIYAPAAAIRACQGAEVAR